MGYMPLYYFFITEAQSVDFRCILTPITFEQVVHQDKIVYTLSYSHYLRAPPIA